MRVLLLVRSILLATSKHTSAKLVKPTVMVSYPLWRGLESRLQNGLTILGSFTTPNAFG
jgi:hypothetical protein